MTDMVVSGAGTSAVNGTYVENGTLNGKPKYTYSTYRIVWKYHALLEDFSWFIDNSAGSANYYIGPQNVATPNLVLLWSNSMMSGSTAVPTVTAAPAGTTHEGEVALSSLSYLRTKKA